MKLGEVRGLLKKLLDRLGWSRLTDTASSPADLEHVLSELEVDTWIEGLLGGALRLEDEIDRDRSREVSTHYKWFLGGRHGYTLWLNEYKRDPAPGHALTLHNHRYGFASRVVIGTLRQRVLHVEHRDGEIESVTRTAEFTSEAGETYSLGADAIHYVTGWTTGTVTLLLKQPALREFSDVFDLEKFQVRQLHSVSTLSPLATVFPGEHRPL